MIKKTLKILMLCIVLSSLLLAGMKINSTIQTEVQENNTILASFSKLSQPVKRKPLNNKVTQNEYNIIKDVNILIEGKKINSKNNLLCKYNRYYFDVRDFEKTLGYSAKIDNNNIYVYNEGKNNSDSSYYSDRFLTHDALIYDSKTYLSMIDITEAFNLTVSWDYDKKNLSFFKIEKKLPIRDRKHTKKPAFIRLEDITAGVGYTNSDNLQKTRIVSDYLYSRSIPFHITWIPRYKKPENGIDNDLLKTYSLSNVDFVYTLDYMINRGGIVGIHGYTHQYGDEQSVVGSEFGEGLCSNLEETRSRIETAISTAKELDIPYEFFVSPHYRATKEQQQKVFENYFNYIFEPSKALYNTRPALSPANNKTIYLPAPLSYVSEDTADGMISRIKNKPRNYVAALFYHPSKEFDYITLTKRDGYPDYNYSEDSILHKIINCLDEEGYTLVKITDIKLDRKKP